MRIEEMSRLRRIGDPPADALVHQIAARGIIGEVNRSLSAWNRNDSAPPDDLPDFLRSWLVENSRLPSWVEPAKLKRAHELFQKHGPMMGLIGLTASFAWMYACPRGAVVMTQSGRFGQQTSRRIAETIQYIFSVAEPGAFSPSGRGICMSLKVRLIHATVRWSLLQRGWDTEKNEGPPLPQLEALATAQCLGPKLIDDLRKLGVEITESEAEAWAHLWRVNAALLGVDPTINPAGHEGGLKMVNAILDHEKGASEAGEELIRQLLKFFAEMLPGQAFDGVPAAVMRSLLDKERCDFLGVPHSRWESVLRAGRSGRVWGWSKSLPGVGSKMLERFALSLIQAHFREVDGVPVQLEMSSDLMTEFHRRALKTIGLFEDAFADGEISEAESDALKLSQAQLQLSDAQMQRMAVIGAVNAATRDGKVEPAELEIIHQLAEKAGMAPVQRDQLTAAISDGVISAKERAWMTEILQIVG